MSEWKPIDTAPRGVVIRTKITDAHGYRKDQLLKLGTTNNLWWIPDGSMYVYYTPTHWMLEPPKGESK